MPQDATPEEFGARGDGQTDDWAAIQAAINTGRKVSLSKRTYRIGKPLELKGAGQVFAGQTFAFIKALPSFPAGGAMIVANDEFQVIENLDLHCDNVAETGVYCDSARQVRVSRVETHASVGDGVVAHGNTWGGIFDHVVVSFPGGNGFNLSGEYHTIFTFRACDVRTPALANFKMNVVEGFVMDGCGTGHGTVFLEAVNAKGVINGADTEMTPRLFDLTNSTVKVSGGRFLKFGSNASPPTDGVVRLANSHLIVENSSFEGPEDLGDGMWNFPDAVSSLVWRGNAQEARRWGPVDCDRLTTDLHMATWACPDNVDNATGDGTVYAIPFASIASASGEAEAEVKTGDMSSGTLTVPYSGFYQFDLSLSRLIASAHTREIVSYSKNGASRVVFYQMPRSADYGTINGERITLTLKLAAGETISFHWDVGPGTKDCDLYRARLMVQRL